MHRSRLRTLMIDCNEAAYEKGIAFWSAALGLEPRTEDQRYSTLEGDAGLHVVLQRVPDQSAFHLDIETDDVDAEAARLEKLGAVRKYKVDTWWVMRAPSGHDFCVVRAQPDFPSAKTKTWDE